ncbi:MAG: hypothetical protein HY903_16505 [Deltaproteobacteria bacterium]|nr:hypothetical protein [Deltaproteobacteria bacterium]
MSSASGVRVPTLQSPTYSEASGVVSQIESQIGSVQSLFADVQSLLNEISALEPPNQGQFKKADGTPDTAAYSNALKAFQDQLTALNRRLETAYRKLGEGQALLAKLQTQDLPAAERRDADRMQQAMKQATELLNGAAKTIQDAGGAKGASEDESANQTVTRIELKVREKKVDVTLKSDPTFKEVIAAFQIMAVVVGQGTPERKYNQMAPPAGGGLPPINTP